MKSKLIELLYKGTKIDETKYAIISDTERINYRELTARALKYKLFFDTRSVKSVCVIADRSVNLYCIVLGIILAGGSYLLYEKSDINASVINKINVVCPDLIIAEELCPDFPDALLIRDINTLGMGSIDFDIRDEETYLYYVVTSGTTGESKIIATKDKNLLCYLEGYITQFCLKSDDNFFQQSPIYYDGFAEEFFSSLIVGGTLIFTTTQNLKVPSKILEVIDRYNVTVFPSTPLMIGEINRMRKHVDIKRIISSGDVLKSSQIDWILNNTRTEIYNMYGLSETTVCATCHHCSKDEKGEISIGRPLPGYDIYLMDDNGNRVAGNDEGEIYISGEGVIDQYFKSEDSKGCFIKNNGICTIKTGDYAWTDADGELHFAGRKDRIVKNKSNRINLKGIESQLLENSSIQDIAVLFDKDKQWLRFFYISDSMDETSFWSFCKERLSPYMMPNQIYRIETIPLTDTGKVDYRCLTKYSEEIACHLDDADTADIDDLSKIVMSALNNSQMDWDKSLEENGIDSFTYISLLVDIEEKYQIELGDELLIMDESMTIEDLCRALREYTEGQQVNA